MFSLHRNIPALRRRDVDTAAIRQHYYPEGGWGWVVCAAGFLARLLAAAAQFAFGLLYLYAVHHLADKGRVLPDTRQWKAMEIAVAWLGALSAAMSLLAAPLAVALCRRKWTRLSAVLAGLVMALGCLFASFAMQLHQLLVSYGLLLGAASGLVRETASLTLGHYFRRRREFVEMLMQAGAGVGIALFSVFYWEAIGQWGWRLGLQAVTVLLCAAFFLGMLYRSASMYHPQRRAIQHLKNQRKKVKLKKTPQHRQPKQPFFDLTPLRIRAVQLLMLAAAVAAFGVYSPLFYLALQGQREGLDERALVLLQTFLGCATALGCVGFGLMVVRASDQCLVSRQYLCQAAMVGIGVSLLALGSVEGYHGYVLIVWLYGVCLGGFVYSFKVFAMECVRSRYFARAWGFVQGAEAVPLLVGVPVTGYINQNHPQAGYYFSMAATLAGAALLFVVGGGSRRGWDSVPGGCGALPDGPLAAAAPAPLSMSFGTPLDLPPPDDILWRPVRSCRSEPESLGRPPPPAAAAFTVVEQITTCV
ncbi:monocarboxylate transporter 12-like [Schistocerca serialis cubense]|uniref:monocarboxylate transporter 12-like n=1 Tax=Schistocerca serialis cubense TaxID=2023355 RepID=UPI00214F5DBD|nr:monocarboxylate transporter 12-like [Schistocerca serialis cubense]